MGRRRVRRRVVDTQTAIQRCRRPVPASSGTVSRMAGGESRPHTVLISSFVVQGGHCFCVVRQVQCWSLLHSRKTTHFDGSQGMVTVGSSQRMVAGYPWATTTVTALAVAGAGEPSATSAGSSRCRSRPVAQWRPPPVVGAYPEESGRTNRRSEREGHQVAAGDRCFGGRRSCGAQFEGGVEEGSGESQDPLRWRRESAPPVNFSSVRGND